MNFHDWLFERSEKTIIYLDLDNTLIYRAQDKCYPRPYVHEFIKQVQRLAPVRILTHGLTGSQTQCANTANINLPVIGLNDYDKILPSPHAILIDNLPATDYKTQIKLQAIGIDPSRLIVVKSWYPQDKDDNELVHLSSRIKQLLTTKEWVERNPQPIPNKQPFKTYAKARDLAKERESKFIKGMKEAAQGHKVISSIKSEGSFKNKTQERGKKPEKVGDVLRGAILVDNKNQIDKVVKELKNIFLVKKVDHKTKPKKPFGYYGATHIDVVINDMICEIQVMTKKLWKYKIQADAIYHKYRGKNTPPEMIDKAKELYRKGNE